MQWRVDSQHQKIRELLCHNTLDGDLPGPGSRAHVRAAAGSGNELKITLPSLGACSMVVCVRSSTEWPSACCSAPHLSR